MPFTRVALGLLLSIVVAAAIGLAQAPAGRQGGRGDRQPDSPLPNIREYKPRSTLVVPEHQVAAFDQRAGIVVGHPGGEGPGIPGLGLKAMDHRAIAAELANRRGKLARRLWL